LTQLDGTYLSLLWGEPWAEIFRAAIKWRQVIVEDMEMPERKIIQERLRDFLLRLNPDRFVGASGIAVLCAASTAALLPASGETIPFVLAQWIGGLGLNVLASVLQQTYQNLNASSTNDEMERLTDLADALTIEIRQQPALLSEIGAFLADVDAFQIAEEVVKGNPAVHGWLLVQIYSDVMHYQSEFEHIHAALAEIKDAISRLDLSSAGVVSTPFMAPRLPLQGVFGRSTDLDEICRWLMLDDEFTEIPPVALRGMGGVGKTTMAIALARLPTIRKYFKHGVLWTELGPKPSLRPHLEGWGRMLDVEMTALPDIHACTHRLREVLHDRSVLLIVDDVWNSADGLHFQVGGPRCRSLFTTRELPVANDMATPARVYQVATISPDAALRLLRALAPVVVAANESQATRLCTKLECLPLAITLAGRYLANEALTERRQQRLIEMLLSSAEERLALPQLERRTGIEDIHPSLRAILGLSVERLDRVDQERFAILSMFGGEPLSWTSEMATYVWECTEDQADTTLTRLQQRGLVERMHGRYRMHALLADFAETLRKEWAL